ncbi:2Fe-2S iron-sulfur cluster-binding protein [Niveispirillum sp. KHB5.9]|uniref:2Fe-2S iron-sulfur cluster-binding protein n=1 Tax=Niveispirillum sp. KHB5.9 TaxID=3400269 RepID=UPI003A8707C4
MAKVHFVAPDGTRETLAIPDGWSAMAGAMADGLDGILGDCGGAMACATCHVYVDPAWVAALPPPTDTELAMLEMAIDPRAESRLACQIRIQPALDGLVLGLPARQF